MIKKKKSLTSWLKRENEGGGPSGKKKPKNQKKRS